MTDTLATNLRAVEERVRKAAWAAGRDESTIRVLPVSKTKPPEDIARIHSLGYRRFGENKVQEALEKSEALHELGLEWAVIGHLQTNKAKYIARFAAEFQALDSLKVARELDKRLQQAGRTMEVLVQVNSSGEAQKFGLDPTDVPGFTAELGAFDALDVRGLMTLAVFSQDHAKVGECFRAMQIVQTQLRDRDGGGWDELSMGMSGDFELAIAHGSTCVRIGQAIFGARLDPNDYWPDAAS